MKRKNVIVNIVNGIGKILNINPKISSEQYGKIYRAFAKLTNDDNVFIYSLDEDQKIEGLYYLEDYCYDGAIISLIIMPGIKKMNIQRVKKTIKDNIDALSFNNIIIKKLI